MNRTGGIDGEQNQVMEDIFSDGNISQSPRLGGSTFMADMVGYKNMNTSVRSGWLCRIRSIIDVLPVKKIGYLPIYSSIFRTVGLLATEIVFNSHKLS